MAEVVVTLDSLLTLQQKIDSSFQAAGKTIYGRMMYMLPFPLQGENSAQDDSRLSSNSKDKKDSTNPMKVFKYSDLEMSTSNFSQDLIIDSDGYGEVFLGWVDEKTFAPSTKGVGITVAVKKYSKGLPPWLTVVTSCVPLAHPNIICLLGYSDDERPNFLLVYEHMDMQKIRNFSRYLFGNVVEPLSWERRLRIMIGVARGLDYLHSSKEQVVHGGIKTYNILLDQKFNAKLGYFGSAKFRYKIHELDDIEDATRSDMDIIRDLEARDQHTGDLTVKGDIYSFGVVLFETLKGQQAWVTKYGFTLVKWVLPFLDDKSKLRLIIDHRLNQNYPLEGAFECIALATRCVAEDRNDRPSSKEVLKSLEQIYSDNR